jgi:hypothetical protein
LVVLNHRDLEIFMRQTSGASTSRRAGSEDSLLAQPKSDQSLADRTVRDGAPAARRGGAVEKSPSIGPCFLRDRKPAPRRDDESADFIEAIDTAVAPA